MDPTCSNFKTPSHFAPKIGYRSPVFSLPSSSIFLSAPAPLLQGFRLDPPRLGGLPSLLPPIGSLALPVHSLVTRIEPTVSPVCPQRRRLADILLGPELTALFEELEEALVVYQCVPAAVDKEALGGEEDTAAV